jgi:hypothetical protein
MNEKNFWSLLFQREKLLIFSIITILALVYFIIEYQNSVISTLLGLIVAIIPEFLSVLIALLLIYFGFRSVQNLKEENENNSLRAKMIQDSEQMQLELYRINTKLDSILQGNSGTELAKFSEKFQTPLIGNWYSTGNWRIEPGDEGANYLVVTDSEAGGIIKHCLDWRDYKFEFETKIINLTSSWIVRAKDTLNYVMLQCNLTEIRPHFRNGFIWCWKESYRLPFELSVNRWFRVQIIVRDMRVVVKISDADDVMHEVLNSDLLKSPIMVADCSGLNLNHPEKAQILFGSSFTHGSVGFREHGSETAHFRNVNIVKL